MVNSRRIWTATALLLAVALVGTGFIPALRLARAKSVARQEGCWLTREEVRQASHVRNGGNNADAMVQDLLTGISLSPLAHDPDLGRWREISNADYLWNVFERGDLADPFMSVSAFSLTSGIDILCDAARHGKGVEENLLAAARLLRLIGRVPSSGPLQWFSFYGHKILETAKRTGRQKAVAEEIGPSPDWRGVIRAVEYRQLKAIDLQNEVYARYTSPLIRFRLSGPFGDSARLSIIEAYRDVLRTLPADSDKVDLAKMNSGLAKICTLVVNLAPAYGNLTLFPIMDQSTFHPLVLFEKERLACLNSTAPASHS